MSFPGGMVLVEEDLLLGVLAELLLLSLLVVVVVRSQLLQLTR